MNYTTIITSLTHLGHTKACARRHAADLCLRVGPAAARQYLAAENLVDVILQKPDILVRLGGFNDMLKAALDLTPRDVQKYFRSKGYTVTWSWRDLWQEAHYRSFTVAKAMQMDVLLTIREQIHRAIDEGIPFRDFARALEPALKSQGWWGRQELRNPKTGKREKVQLGSWERLQTIYYTNMSSAYMKGRYDGMLSAAQARPYWQYLAVTDPRTRDEHMELHGKVFAFDDPIWKRAFPPNGYRCRCHAVSLSPEEVKRDKLTVEKGSAYKDWHAHENFNHGPQELFFPDKSKYPPEFWAGFRGDMKDAGLWPGS